MNQTLEFKEIPPEIKKRHRTWQVFFEGYTSIHYIVGVVGVIASVLSATQASKETNDPLFGIISAACIAILGFVQPDKQYRKYVNAWRILDRGINQYRHGLIDIKDLVASLNRAESSINRHEEAVDGKDADQKKPSNE